MSTTDEELDKLFRDAAANVPSPEYKPEFFADIERQLPVKKARRSLAWWWTANLFLVAFIAWTSVEVFRMIIPIGNESLVGKNEQKRKLNYTSGKTGNTANTGNGSSDVSGKKVNKTEITVNNDSSENSFSGLSQANSERVLGKNDEELNPLEIIINEDQRITEEIIPVNEEVNTVVQEITSYKNNDLNLELKDLNSEFTTAELIAAKMFGSPSKRLSYYAELNLGVEQAWMQSEEENSSAVNGVIGINGGVTLTQGKFRYSLGLGLNYTKFDDLKIKERSIIYGFGSDILENTYAFNSMLAVTVPLRAEYVFGRHSLDLNLVSSFNILTQVHRYQHVDGKEIVSRTGYSNTSLFNQFGFKPMIGYSYFVKENTQIGLKFGAQLLTPIQSDRFVGSPTTMPFEGQFYIRQTITTRK